MTTENPTTPAATTPAPAPAAPPVDVAKLTADITKQVTENANKFAEEQSTKLVTQKLAAIGKALSGEPATPQDTNRTVLETFVADPLKALHTVQQGATQKAVQIINDQLAVKAVQNEVASKYVGDYPEFMTSKVKIKTVEKLADDYANAGMDYKEALDKAFQETIKDLDLKSVSKAQESNAVRMVALPGGGGYSPQPTTFDAKKSESDFFSGMKAKMNSFRDKK